MENVENVENITARKKWNKKVYKSLRLKEFYSGAGIKEYPQILNEIFDKNLWILWIVIFEGAFHRLLQHPRHP